MSELREVFEMVTKQAEPDVDAWRDQERRQRRKSRNRKLGALAVAAAIGIVAVVVVIRAADVGTGTQPGGQPTDTTELPTEQTPPLPSGSVEPGRYVFRSYDPGLDASHRITIDVPEGYMGVDGLAALKSGFSQTGVATMAISHVYADACQWEGTQLDRSEISSADDLAVALASQQGLRISTPTDVTIGGFAGTYMERKVPARTVISDCDGAQFRVYLVPGWGSRYLVPGQLQQLWILDVDGVPLVIDASIQTGTSAQVRAEVVQMVESVQINPRQEG
jgi:hypothetical protein